MRMNEIRPFTKVADTKSQYVRLDTITGNGGKLWHHRIMWSDTVSETTVTENYSDLEDAIKSFDKAVINL
ncbi:hypothetical protein [Erwinia phage Pecta]|nr:hypothetical protein [Erwinia phage Pecta]